MSNKQKTTKSSNEATFTKVQKKNGQKGKKAPKPETPQGDGQQTVEAIDGVLFTCDKCELTMTLPRHPVKGAKITCPYVGQHDLVISSMGQAMRMLSGAPSFKELTSYPQRKACEYLWTCDMSDKPAAIAVVNGSYTKGIKEAGTRMLWKTHLQLTPAQVSSLTEAHPGYWFVTGTTHHDHPLAHINTQIASRGLVARIVAAGGTWLDLHGNPASNARSNVRHPGVTIKTMVELCTPKDHIRAATKWGNWQQDKNVFSSSMRDISVTPSEASRTLVGGLAGAISIHTLYYYEKREIGEFLAQMPNRPLHALVHRFPENEGSLSFGEMRYARESTSFGDRITQTNILTGESYEHPDNEWMFSGASSWHNGKVGFGWTISKAGVDSYLVSLVAVPVTACRMDVFGARAQSSASRVADGNVSVVLETDLTPTDFPLTCPKTVAAMCGHVSGKARTSEQFKDHLAATKRTMKKFGTFETKSVVQTAVYSFVRDMEEEKEVLRVIGDLRGASREMLRNVGTGTALDEMSVLSKVLTAAATLSGDKKLSACFRMGSALAGSYGERIE